MDGSPGGTGRPGRSTGEIPLRRLTGRTGGRGRCRRARLGAGLGAAVVVALALTLTGCSPAAPSDRAGTASGAPRAASGAPVGVTGATVVHRQMVIETGKEDGRSGWPRFVPSAFSAPAGATIVLTIVNHDDGTAPLPPASPWGKVWGSDPTFGMVSGGTELVNGKAVADIPNAQVSHTFTVPGLLVNVPIPVAVSGTQPTTVVFTFKVAKAGTYSWLCTAPCGSGTAGMGGAMDTSGWMEGYVHIT